MKVASDFRYRFGRFAFVCHRFSLNQFDFSAEDRCRHYMINQLKNSKYNVIGEAKVHPSLDALIDYYRTVSFTFLLEAKNESCFSARIVELGRTFD